MDDRTLALLGDRAAQERITELGELLPCHCIGSAPQLAQTNIDERNYYHVLCRSCGSGTFLSRNKRIVIKAWNTRAPILTSEQIERLEDKP